MLFSNNSETLSTNTKQYDTMKMLSHYKYVFHLMLPLSQGITKTRLYKYIENFTSKNWKFLDKKF